MVGGQPLDRLPAAGSDTEQLTEVPVDAGNEGPLPRDQHPRSVPRSWLRVMMVYGVLHILDERLRRALEAPAYVVDERGVEMVLRHALVRSTLVVPQPDSRAQGLLLGLLGR